MFQDNYGQLACYSKINGTVFGARCLSEDVPQGDLEVPYMHAGKQ